MKSTVMEIDEYYFQNAIGRLPNQFELDIFANSLSDGIDAAVGFLWDELNETAKDAVEYYNTQATSCTQE